MPTLHKAIVALTMGAALSFGSLHLLLPEVPYDFDRLHIFLFNLCAGGFVLLHHALLHRPRERAHHAYFPLALAYAIAAFLELHVVSLLLSVPLILIVERARIRRFGSFFPWRFLRSTPVQDKFLEAALLCLSLGLGAASIVIANNEYLRAFHLEKLTIDIFFLGYSFPLSLLALSVAFSLPMREAGRAHRVMAEVSFWSITIGVILFFFFIIFDLLIAEVLAGVLLLLAVCATLALFVRGAPRTQQKQILVSGMAFLVLTGLTGVGYLIDRVLPSFEATRGVLLTWHSTVALHGWNLSGLFVAVRWRNFPIEHPIARVILLHWLTVLVLAPAALHVLPVAAVALPAYMVLVCGVFFARTRKEETR